MKMLNDMKMYARYARGLQGFLRHTISLAEARAIVRRRMAERETNFLHLLERGIFANSRSPYRALVQHAGLEFADVVHLVRKHGIEGALERLYDAGVYVTLDEFKGRKPLERPGLYLAIQPEDFDNPLLARHYEARTGGSRGVGTRLLIDFDLLMHEAATHSLFLTAFAVVDRPMGLWRPLPPGLAGMKNLLRHAKLGRPVERWFTQNRMTLRPETFKYLLFTIYTIYGSRLFGRPLPVPEYVPLAQASQVARWLAMKKRVRTPAHLDTNASSGVRVCLAAKEHGLDIAGTLFRFGGEPYTPAKYKVIAETGSRAVCHYSMAEIGHIGIACAAPAFLDDVHLLKDKVAVIQREKSVGTSGVSVGALIHTTLFLACPKIMLNVESGDYGELPERSCGCPLEALGFQQHLHTIRSYDKLTSEGMTFIGSDLIILIEEILPARFGGNPTDYQFVEEEDGGLPKVSILVSPRVGNVDETKLITTVLQTLRSSSNANKMMADQWRKAQTLEVIRREPYATDSAKILPLHILKEDNISKTAK